VAVLAHDDGNLRFTRKKSLRAVATLMDLRAHEPRRPGAVTPRSGARPRRHSPPSRTTRYAGHAASALVAVAAAGRHAFRPEYWILAALGIAWLGGGPGLRGGFLAGLVGLHAFVLFGLQMSSGYVSWRHALPPLLPLLGYVALGVPVFGRLLLALPRRLLHRGPPSPGLALGIGLALLAGASTAIAVHPRRVPRAATRAAAEWLAAQGDARRVAATKQRDAYYARARFARLPEPRDEQGLDWVEALRRKGVRFAILDEGTAKRYPELESASARPAPGDRLRIVHRAEARGRTAVVVEILGVD